MKTGVKLFYCTASKKTGFGRAYTPKKKRGRKEREHFSKTQFPSTFTSHAHLKNKTRRWRRSGSCNEDCTNYKTRQYKSGRPPTPGSGVSPSSAPWDSYRACRAARLVEEPGLTSPLGYDSRMEMEPKGFLLSAHIVEEYDDDREFVEQILPCVRAPSSARPHL